MFSYKLDRQPSHFSAEEIPFLCPPEQWNLFSLFTAYVQFLMKTQYFLLEEFFSVYTLSKIEILGDLYPIESLIAPGLECCNYLLACLHASQLNLFQNIFCKVRHP